MKIDTQKLMIGLIFMNIIIGISIGVFHDATNTYEISTITTTTNMLETEELNYGDEDKIYNLQTQNLIRS